VYVNGSLSASSPATGPLPTGLPITVGANSTGAFGGNYFNGSIDEVSIYNRALSDSEIQSIYDAGTAGKCKSCLGIAATSLTWDTSQGGVDYEYTISSDLPNPTTAALYWAPTATFDSTQDTLIPGSVFTTATAAQNGPYTGHIGTATIGTPPPRAKDLLFVVDPTNLISPADPSKVASLALSDIAATSLTWDTTRGGVDFSYQVLGSVLQEDVPIAFYWASDSDVLDNSGALDLRKITPDSLNNLMQLDSATITVRAGTAAQSNPVDPIPIDPSKLTGSPDDATYLLEVTDPNNTLGNFDPSVNVCALQLQLSLPQIYNQRVGAWAAPATNGQRPLLGNSKTDTIYDFGCTLTDLAMELSYEGLTVDPLTLNNLLKGEPGAFSAVYPARLVLPVATQSAALSLSPGGSSVYFSDYEGSSNAQTLRNELMQSASPVLVHVEHYGNDGKLHGHYVLVTGFKDGDFTIIDPGYSINAPTELSYYTDLPWYIRGEVRDPVSLSGLFVTVTSVGSPPSLVIHDDLGNVTGTNQTTGQTLTQIPGSFTYVEGPLENFSGGPDDNTFVEEVDIYNPVNGVFSIDASAAGPYAIQATGFAPDGHLTGNVVVTGTSSPGAFSELKLSSSNNGLQNTDTPPALALASTASTTRGANFTASGSFSSPASGLFSATVDYGDGSGAQPVTLSPSHTCMCLHIYTNAGMFTVTVAVTDPFGLVGTQTLSVKVAPLVSGYGVGRDAFVTTLYTDVLGRLPELTTGLDFWSGVLAKGAKPKTVGAAIWNSVEHRSLVKQHLAPGIPFRRSYSDALFAGRQDAQLHRSK
jgi:hypothetical protein